MAMTVRLPADLDSALGALAAARHTSKHALLIEAADRFVNEEQRTADTVATAHDVAQRYASLLQRLADA